VLRLLRSEFYRLRRRWIFWVLLATILATPFLLYLLVYFSANAQLQNIRSGNTAIPPEAARGQAVAIEQTLRMLRPDRVQAFGVSVVNGLGTIMLIVFAASHLGTEYGWGTLRTLLAHGASRSGFLATKCLSLLLFAIGFAFIGAVAAIAASYLTAALAGFETSPGVDLGEVASASAHGVFGFVPYMALATAFAIATRAAGSGITAGLVVYFAEGIVASVLVSLNRDFAPIVNYGISRNVASITRVASAPVATSPSGEPLPTTLPDPGQAAVVLLLYTAAFLAFAWWQLRRRDVTLG